jgi:uncharacterized protein
MNWLDAIAGLVVGLLVGLTGVGGGSLMSPILILIFGVAPVTAVGTDLWFACITKTVGGVVHQRLAAPDWQIVRLLACGSLPAAALTVLYLSHLDIQQIKGGFTSHALGSVLILTAIATLFRRQLHGLARTTGSFAAGRYKRLQSPMTVLAGVILGVLVTLTSVGAGALGAAMLLSIYPIRLTARRLVGTDIIHAVPLTLVAGLGHLWIGTVDWKLLVGLLIGSIPGIILGSLLTSRVPDRLLRPVLSAVLVFAGYRLLIS